MKTSSKITTKINHQIIEIEGEKAFSPLASFLRNDVLLCGTKIVCSEGDCGACTVLIADQVDNDGKLKFRAVNSCILPLYLTNGAQVVTVEGIGESKEMGFDLHEVQKKMIDFNGAQCGYCTPGFICSMTSAIESVKQEGGVITEKKAKNFLTGNLCRCTGYKPIVEALVNVDLDRVNLLSERYRPDQEWQIKMETARKETVAIEIGTHQQLYLPTTLSEALQYKSKHPHLRIIGGGTDIGVVVNKGKLENNFTMGLYHIQELKKIEINQDELVIGAGVTLSEFEQFIQNHIPEMSRMLHIFASPQIKNQATLIGNVVNASPIADTIPFLIVSDAKIICEKSNHTREVLLKDFYLGYKKLDLSTDELVTKIKIPLLNKFEKIKLYKVSMRKDLDISAVTFAGRFTIEDKIIKEARLALGGVGATVLRLFELEKKILGKEVSEKNFTDLANELDQYIFPLSDLRASKEYRMIVAKNFFKKCAIELENDR